MDANVGCRADGIVDVLVSLAPHSVAPLEVTLEGTVGTLDGERGWGALEGQHWVLLGREAGEGRGGEGRGGEGRLHKA